MKGFFRLCLSLLLFSVWVKSQDAEPAPESPDTVWLFDFLQPYGGRHDFSKAMGALAPKLKDPVVWQRLVRIVRGAEKHDFIEKLLPREETETALSLLGYVQNDEAVAVIAPYLKHQSIQVRENAAESLRITHNPKAVLPLKAALLEAERQLPGTLVADRGTEVSVNALSTYFRSLSMIRSDEALAALDESLARLKARYGNSSVGRDLVGQLEHIREIGGIQEYRRTAAAPAVQSTTQPPPENAPLPVPPVPSATPVAWPMPTPRVAQPSALSAEGESPTWPLVVGIAALTVIVYLVWERRT